jgi:hypothetical protein
MKFEHENGIVYYKDDFYYRKFDNNYSTHFFQFYYDEYSNKTFFCGYIVHRDDGGPAIERSNGAKEWFFEGKRHRKDMPAVEFIDGSKKWYFHGNLHRTDGPAVERCDGYKEWRFNGKLHRKDGPAVEHSNGAKEWFINGKLHREDGPASNHTICYGWWLNGIQYTEQKYWKVMNLKNKKKVLDEIRI